MCRRKKENPKKKKKEEENNNNNSNTGWSSGSTYLHLTSAHRPQAEQWPICRAVDCFYSFTQSHTLSLMTA
jgi:hypothetical protein